MTKRYLVLCTANRCRSQMAHGWLQHLGKVSVEVFSAGTKPHGVHPLSIQVMQEAGIDISSHRSDPVDQYLGEDFDAAITVCDNAREACPVLPGARRTIHQPFDDPDDKTGRLSDEQMLPTFRRVRDEIGMWARDFLQAEGIKLSN